MTKDYGVTTVAEGFKKSLSDYLQAQYHIRDEALVAERKRLFDKPGIIAQVPYIEATASYATLSASGRKIGDLKISKHARDFLEHCSDLNIGIPKDPYIHQADAIETFLGDGSRTAGKDILVSTGTGSGKTEIFLMNILASLADEAIDRSESKNLVGCRALLLYPMNALVSDQLARVRRLFGNEGLAAELQSKFGRRIRFGMYTGRTPFPGEFTSAKCRQYIQPLFEKYFLKYGSNPKIKSQLVAKGRWPTKDLEAFYAAGEKRWENRLKTQPGDTELLLRHEMQKQCPDLLITNYSMLEYMMLRPIERSIFQQTKDWLHSDSRNYLTLILDEAHMYRGTGGAEVAMLIRRLMARLEIPRSRLRCILTSASIGSKDDAKIKALQFAEDLTGLKADQPPGFKLIVGTREELKKAEQGTPAQAKALSDFDLGAFQNLSQNAPLAIEALNSLLPKLNLQTLSENPALVADSLYKGLSTLGLTNCLISEISAKSKEFSALTLALFPNTDKQVAERATQALLSLANYSCLSDKKKVLLPARLHLFYKGPQGLFVCINRNCSARSNNTAPSTLGNLWTAPRQFCACGARVFELLTHRDCGTEYIRGYIQHGRSLDFLFHEKESDVGAMEMTTHHRLREIHLLVGNKPHPNAQGDSHRIWVELWTGKLQFDEPATPNDYIEAQITNNASPDSNLPHTFSRCPVCLKGWADGRSKIMDLRTKGEQPFAALVEQQLFLQPPTRSDVQDFPNQGRKVLLFSDGRQKAARLARDIPRLIEADSFRESLILAVQSLTKIHRQAVLADKTLYLAFIDVLKIHHLSYFDGHDQKLVLHDIDYYQKNFGGNLQEAFEEWQQLLIPERFKQALLRQLCSPYYSIPFVTAGWIKPKDRILQNFTAKLVEHDLSFLELAAQDIACAWIAELAKEFALKGFSSSTCNAVAGYPKRAWGHTGKNLSESLTRILISEGVQSQKIDLIKQELLAAFCGQPENGLFLLDRNNLFLNIDMSAAWYQCTLCQGLYPYAPLGHCSSCSSKSLKKIDPGTDPYIQSRKGLWRNPIIECLDGRRSPKSVNVEEHTAQLSHRDAGTILATTEQHELLFQDIIIDHTQESPVDILSCTTTMEVGIDIGSLVAVGLRNVPPQRENYQQRAGRSGRRGSAVSTVVTYCQGGPHDSHYFNNVERIVSGEPRAPMIKIKNAKIARRHVHAFLIQSYFLNFPGSLSGILNSALGQTVTFFSEDTGQPCYSNFIKWIKNEMLDTSGSLAGKIASWLPPGINANMEKWVKNVAKDFSDSLGIQGDEFIKNRSGSDSTEDDEGDNLDNESNLLEFLFFRGYLPTYAFPNDLSSFNVERFDNITKRIQVVERPQQAINKALSEYAPGRLVVIDKKTYRCEAVVSNTSTYEWNRAAPLFNRTLKHYIFCSTKGCSYVRESATDELASSDRCPLCKSELKIGKILRPEVFLPDKGMAVDELDTEQEMTFASPAQFPIPLRMESDSNWFAIGTYAEKTFAEDRNLVVINKGDPERLDGFQVCQCCGRTKLFDGNLIKAHRRPYDISKKSGSPPPPLQCEGESSQVYLGNEFKTDLMILRLRAKSPLEVRPLPGLAAFAAMQNAMRTLAEALNLSASRRLDLDPAEFSCGYRVFPTNASDEVIGEIYLFDTLSGGAGYSSQIGEELLDVLKKDIFGILIKCDNPDCDRSCYDCLRHYGNQFYHTELDRNLGLTLLDYALYGKLPPLDDWSHQIEVLRPLARLLELSGLKATLGRPQDASPIPLSIVGPTGTLILGSCNGLYSTSSELPHPLLQKRKPGDNAFIINEYLLTRNLPAVHRDILSKVRS